MPKVSKNNKPLKTMITKELHLGQEVKVVKIDGSCYVGLTDLAKMLSMSRQGALGLLNDMRQTHEITVFDLGRRTGIRVCVAEFLAALADRCAHSNS